MHLKIARWLFCVKRHNCDCVVVVVFDNGSNNSTMDQLHANSSNSIKKTRNQIKITSLRMNSDMVLSLVIPNLKVVMHQSIEATIEKVKKNTNNSPTVSKQFHSN